MTVTVNTEQAKTYLGEDTSWPDDAIESAFNAERKAQARVCRVPEDDEYEDDLAEALFRRVAHNLALRGLPLGVQATLSDSAVATNKVGGTDAEVRRLEGPFRRNTVG